MLRPNVLVGAIILLGCLLFATPAWSQDAFDAGVAAYRAERFEEALGHFERAAEAEPSSAEVQLFLGLTLSSLDRPDEATAAFREARRLDPSLPGVDLNLGIALYRGGDCPGAETALERVLAAEPGEASAHYFLGMCADQQDRPEEALAHFEEARRDPELAQLAWYQIGLIHARAGRLDQSEDALLQAVRIQPETETAAAARRQAQSLARRRSAGKRWWIRAGTGVEWDDNVSVPDIDVNSDIEASAGLFEFGAGIKPIDHGATEVELAYDLYQSLYADDTADRADLMANSFSALANTEWRGWDPGIAYRFTHTTRGGDDFLTQNELDLTLGRPIIGAWYVLTGYELDARNFDDFPERDGYRHAGVLNQFFFFGEQKTQIISLRYRLEGQDAEGRELDYLGNTIFMGIRGPLPVRGLLERLRYGISFQYYNRDYSNRTVSIDSKRDDDNYDFRFSLRHPILRYLDAVFEYQHITQDSNLPSADYSNNILTWRIEMNL